MIRNDFVSNSSSCSFFVYIETQKDLEELSKIWSKVRKYTNNHVEVFPKGLEYAVTHSYCGEYITTGYLDDNDWNMIEPGEAIRVSSGDDHYDYFEEDLERLYDLFANGKHKFKIFCDSDAHYTKGEWFEDVYGRKPDWKEDD